MKDFLFDVNMQAAIRVQAETEEEARKIMAEALDCADGNLGVWPNGDPITCEISAHGTPVAVEIDGEATGQSGVSPDVLLARLEEAEERLSKFAPDQAKDILPGVRNTIEAAGGSVFQSRAWHQKQKLKTHSPAPKRSRVGSMGFRQIGGL